MIQFHCQHCGNYMRIGEEFAGRDACCKACKRYIIIPKADGTILDVFSLPTEERLRRTEQLLQFTTEKNQQFRALLAPYQDAQGRLIPPAQLRLAGDRLSTADLEELERLRRQFQEWSNEKAELEQQQAALAEQASEAGQSLILSETACAELRTELVEAQDSIRALRESLSEQANQIQELESGLVAYRESAQATEETLEQTREALRTREESLEAEMSHLRYELDRAHEAMEHLRAEQADQESRNSREEVERRILEAERDGAVAQSVQFTAVLDELALALERGMPESGGSFEDRGQAMLESLSETLFQLESRLPLVAADEPEFHRLLTALRVWAADARACLEPPGNRVDTVESQDEETLDQELTDERSSPEDPMAQAYMRFLGP